jgi:hypothetical protein
VTLKAGDITDPLDPQTEDEVQLDPLEDIDSYSAQQAMHIGRLPPIKYCTRPEYYLIDSISSWLPKNFGEEDKVYQQRAQAALSSFEPFYGYLKGLIVGTALRKPPAVPEDIDPKWKEFFANVDLKGSSLGSFLKEAKNAAIDGGCVGIWTEYPVVEEGMNLQEERRLGYRPYFTLIKSEDILETDYSIESVGTGKQKKLRVVTSYLRIKTFHKEERKSYKAIVEYRSIKKADGTLDRVAFTKYIKREDKYVAEPERRLGVTAIPIEFVYGGEPEEHGIGRPLLLDVARLNLRHWASSADLDMIIHEHAASIPYATGVRNDEDLSRDSSKILTVENSNAKLGYMSAGMDGCDIILKRLEKLEASMEKLATVAMSTGKTQAESGFSKLLDRAQSDSQLAMIVNIMEDSLNYAIEHAGAYYRMPPVQVSLNKDFVPVKLHSQQIQAYTQCYEGDQWDIETQLNILNAGDVFEGVPDFSVKKLLARMGLTGNERASQLGIARLKPTTGNTPGSAGEPNTQTPETAGL